MFNVYGAGIFYRNVNRDGMGLDLKLKSLPHCFVFSYWKGTTLGVAELGKRGGARGKGVGTLRNMSQDSPPPPPPPPCL